MQFGRILGFSVGPIGAALLGAISLPVTAWMFSADDLGRIAMLQTVTSLLIIVVGLGLDQSYLREYHQAGDRRLLFRRVTLPGLLLSVLGATAILVIAPDRFASAIFGSTDATLSFTAILAILAAYCSRYLSLIVRMEERGLAFSMSQLLPKIIFLSALLLLYVSNGQRTFSWLLTIHLASILATMLVFAWNTRHVWMNLETPQPDASPKLGNLMGFGVPLMLAGLAFWGVETVDKVMLRYLGSFAELGIYSLAIGIASIAGTLSVIFTTIWMPTAYRWANEPDCARRIEAVAQKLVAAGGILICITGAFTWMLGLLLPAEYSSVQHLVCLCMVPPVLYATAEVTGSGLGISRKSAPMMLITLIAGVLNVLTNLALIPLLGATGAAISTAVSFYVFLVLRSEAAMRCWHPMRRKPLYIPTAAVTATAILLSLIGPDYPNVAIAIWFGAAILLVRENRKMLEELMDRFKMSRKTDPVSKISSAPQIECEQPGSKP